MQAGYTLYECACGDSYQTDRVSPLGHTYVDSVCVRCGQESLFGPGIVKPIVPVITGIGTTSTFSANGQVLEATIVQTYDYIYNGGSLSQMTVVTTVDGEEAGTDTLYFAYASGPMSVTYNGTVYYYVTNLQGDVVAILNTSGTAVVQYTYDAWGNVLSITGSMADTLGQMNPLRYRGYVYDSETELYYLQSRYYDPKVGRFINADAFASTGQGLLGNNMFAYCGNNPVMGYDPQGLYDRETLKQQVKTIAIGFNTGGGGGGFAIGAGWLINEANEILLSFGAIAIAIQTALEASNERGNYYVYVLVGPDNSVEYVGRTQHPAGRERAHARNPAREGLTFEIVGSKLNYMQARGLEQVLMLYYHTIDTSNRKNNQINGISPNNSRKHQYILSAEGALGYIWNQVSNEVLVWLGQ